jgi:hypothetical protein
LQEWRGQTTKAFFCRLVFGSTSYNIWRNRSTLRQRNNPWIKEKLVQHIKWDANEDRFITKGKFKKIKGNDSL